MNLEKRIIAFVKLGEILRKRPEGILSQAIEKASAHNGWFTEENILLAIGSLGEMLKEEKIRKWLNKYPQVTNHKSQVKKIGVIMAGNIPLVGFHDFLCVLMSGNVFVGKLSSEDEFFLPVVSEILCEIESEFVSKISFTKQVQSSKFKVQSFSQQGTRNKEQGTAVDAFIATGSNNSARYFEYYFGKYPHIIRKNRNAIAILTGEETESDLKNLGKDIFQYFGMGCRNVSKIYIPQDYDLDKFFSAIVDFGDVINHNKYYNNHIYYRTIYLLNKEKFLDNNFLMLKESEQIASPVATLYYERYKSKEELFQKLEKQKENIQCIVSNLKTKDSGLKTIPFGQTQSPELWDYADGVDTMEFLLALK
ncbi:MAG: acyl-CoA reductase, partial [Bacteroidia bacterium]